LIFFASFAALREQLPFLGTKDFMEMGSLTKQEQ